jgi:uncharacterized protein YjbJ (UPF0337 family)
MNENTVNGKWTEIKGEIQKAWGDLTGDDLERTKGNVKAISGLIEQKYGQKKEEISSKLDSIMAKYGAKADRVADRAEATAADKSEQVKQSLKRDRP